MKMHIVCTEKVAGLGCWCEYVSIVTKKKDKFTYKYYRESNASIVKYELFVL
jgi:hypothetical protein